MSLGGAGGGYTPDPSPNPGAPHGPLSGKASEVFSSDRQKGPCRGRAELGRHAVPSSEACDGTGRAFPTEGRKQRAQSAGCRAIAPTGTGRRRGNARLCAGLGAGRTQSRQLRAGRRRGRDTFPSAHTFLTCPSNPQPLPAGLSPLSSGLFLRGPWRPGPRQLLPSPGYPRGGPRPPPPPPSCLSRCRPQS